MTDIAQQRHLTPYGLASAVAVGIIGALIIWIVPGFVGLIADQARLDDRQLGYVAAWDINSTAAAIGISTFLLRRVSWRTLVLLGLGLIVAGNLGTALGHTYVPIIAARVLAGAGEGLAIGISFAALGRARNPDRAFAIYLVAGAVIAAGVLLLLPVLQARLGPERIFVGIALLAVAVALGVPWFPSGGSATEPLHVGKPVVVARLAVAGLTGVFLYFLAQGALWSYFERIGHASGIGATQISSALATSTIAGIGGAALAGVLPPRLGRAWPLALSGAVSVVSFMMLLGHVSVLTLVVAGVLLTFAWNLSQPLLSGLCSEADREGRVVCAMGCIQTVGFGLGPAVAAMLLSNQNFTPVIWMSTSVLLVSLVIVIAGIRSHGRAAALVIN